jgi:hypothetical protein
MKPSVRVVLINFKVKKIMFAKAGEIAGAIWNALNENGAMSAKDLKKAAKAKSEKDLYLGLGWLLREDKLNAEGDEKDPIFSLK